MGWLLLIAVMAVLTLVATVPIVLAVLTFFPIGGKIVSILPFGREKSPSDPELVAHDKARLRKLRADKTRMTRPTVLLQPGGEAGRSRLGGAPNLPAGCEWPVGREGPLDFLWQVDLAEVRRAGGPDWLPGEGLLCLFHNEDHGMADQCRVLHAPSQDAVAMPPPTLPKTWRYRERGVGLKGFSSVPSMDWLDIGAGHGDAWDRTIDDDAQAFGDGPQHRIGGYPYEIQSEAMWLSCEYESRGLIPDQQTRPPDAEVVAAAQSWRLLFQIDSDEKLGTSWGDAGMLYVFIREEDARAGDFSKTVTLSQTH